MKRQFTINNNQSNIHYNEEFDRESEEENESKKLNRQNTKSIALIMKQKVYE